MMRQTLCSHYVVASVLGWPLEMGGALALHFVKGAELCQPISA